MSLADDFKRQFRNGNVTAQLIIINAVVFILANIYVSLNNHQPGLVKLFMLPSSVDDLLFQPWSLVTYMFLHMDFTHVLLNMLWLYWMGRIFCDYIGTAKMLSLYLASGIAGGVLFMLVCKLTSSPSVCGYLLGASASVMGIVIAIAAFVPNFVIHLLIFGPVQLKYVALVSFILTTVLDLSINTGGKVAHMGGALLGYIFVVQLKKGSDILRFMHRLTEMIKTLFTFKPRSRVRVAYKKKASDDEYNTRKADNQKRIDDILDKISKSGYDSLSKEEKELLFRQGNKN